MTSRFIYVNIDLRHQCGISVAESQTFLLAKRPSAAMSEEKRLPFAGYYFIYQTRDTMFRRTLQRKSSKIYEAQPSAAEFFPQLFKYNGPEKRSRYKTLTTTDASYCHYKQPDRDYHYTLTTQSWRRSCGPNAATPNPPPLPTPQAMKFHVFIRTTPMNIVVENLYLASVSVLMSQLRTLILLLSLLFGTFLRLSFFFFKHLAFTSRVQNIMKLRFYFIRILLSDWKSRRFEDKTRMESQQHRKSKRLDHNTGMQSQKHRKSKHFEDNTGMEFQQQQV